MSVGFLDHRKLARALASDPRLGLIAAARREHLAEMAGDPIAVLREVCERIKRSAGGIKPSVIMVPDWLPGRIIDSLRANIALAERMLGSGCEPEGRFPNGWPWSKRKGRPSKEERHLTQGLPGWRSLLAKMTRPISNGGTITLASALGHRQEGLVSGVMMDEIVIGDRRGGKTMMAIEMHERTWASIQDLRRANRRPTGKRAQRRAGKEWNR